MPDCLVAAEAALPASPPAVGRAARLAKFEREQLIVDYLNRGVSVAEIAARIEVSEKRMRAIIREILARRMPYAPEEFVAIQVSRLNEALLVAYSAMSIANLKAVDQVVRIVRELDRYHGFAAAGRRRLEPERLEAPAEGSATYGGALVCQAEWAPASDEDKEIEMARDPLAPLQRGEGWGEGRGRLAADARPAPHPSLLPVNGEKGSASVRDGDEGPRNPPQASENMESGLGRSTGFGAQSHDLVVRPSLHLGAPRPASEDVGGEAPAAACRDEGRPRNPPQVSETIESGLGMSSEREARSPDVAPSLAQDPGLGSGETPRAVSQPERDEAPSAAFAQDSRPRNPPQAIEDIESAPGPAIAPERAPPPVAPAYARFANVRMTLNGMMAY